MPIHDVHEHHDQLRQLALALFPLRAPRDVDQLDAETSVAMQRAAGRIAGAVRAITSSYIDVAPVPLGGEPRTLPPEYGAVASLAHALLARADWLNGAWLRNQYAKGIDRPEPPIVAL